MRTHQLFFRRALLLADVSWLAGPISFYARSISFVILIAICTMSGGGNFTVRSAAAQTDEATRLSQQVETLTKERRYSEAIPIAQRLLATQEKVLGPTHLDVAVSLFTLAELYKLQRRYADAELAYKRTLTIQEKAIGSNHPNVALSLNNLAQMYAERGRLADAEPLFKRSLAIRERTLGPDQTAVATSLNNLASFTAVRQLVEQVQLGRSFSAQILQGPVIQ